MSVTVWTIDPILNQERQMKTRDAFTFHFINLSIAWDFYSKQILHLSVFRNQKNVFSCNVWIAAFFFWYLSFLYSWTEVEEGESCPFLASAVLYMLLRFRSQSMWSWGPRKFPHLCLLYHLGCFTGKAWQALLAFDTCWPWSLEFDFSNEARTLLVPLSIL